MAKSGTFFSDLLVDSNSPAVYALLSYSSTRNGNTVTFNITPGLRIQDIYGFRNNRWACRIWVNGVLVEDNLTLKNQTSGAIGTNWYATTVSKNVTVASDYEGSIALTVQFADTGYSTSWSVYTNWGTYGTYFMGYDALPIINLTSVASKTHNSMSLNWASATIVPSSVRIYDNSNNLLATSSSNPINITGLNSNTNYTFYAKGYGNGGWSNNYGTGITDKTYPSPVSVSTYNVSDINPFGCTLSMSSSNPSTTSAVEYSIYTDSDALVWTSGEISPQWIYAIGNVLNEETNYVAKFRVKTSESGVWSGYATQSFVTTSDQARVFINSNGSLVKGRVFMKINNSWIVAKKIYIKKDGIWKIGINN